MDAKTHTANGWNYYQTFSLWDTYRTQATFHALFAKNRAADIVRSMYQARVEGGWFPRWSLGSVETNIMAGDPVSPWIAENFTLGTVPDDIAGRMWDYLVENATTAPPVGVASVGRQSAAFYLANGHIPYYPEGGGGLGAQFEEYRHGGSATMEFAAADASIGSAAQRLGKTGQAAEFLARGTNWSKLWNPDVTLSGGFKGIVNAVTPEGQFVSVPERTDVTRSGFHEGTPWHYQWMATQDVVGLQQKMGGREEFVKRLDYYFNQPALQSAPGVSPSSWAAGGSTYYTSIGYNPGNEPMLMNPWLYGFVGEPAKTNDVLAANLNRFPNTPGGGVGNDDLGTLAAWYVMASLGIQPVMPGSGIMALNAPKVQAATITLESGEKLRITAAGAKEKLPSYIAGVTVNDKVHTAAWVDVDELRNGGRLDFALSGTNAGLDWATAQKDWIPSVSAPRKATPVIVPGADLTAIAGQEKTIEVARVTLAGAVEPITATVSWAGGDPVAATVTEDNGAWVIRSTSTFAAAASVSCVVSIASAANTPRFSPPLFAPTSTNLTVLVTAAPVDPPVDPPVNPPVDRPVDPPVDSGVTVVPPTTGTVKAVSGLADTGMAPTMFSLLFAALGAIALGSAFVIRRKRAHS